MDRRSSKHGPHVDEQMAKEAQGVVHRGSSGGRADEWHHPEPAADDLAIDLAESRGSAPAGMTAAERDERSSLGRYLRRSIFPADRARLVEEARAANASDAVVSALEDLPADRRYQTIAEVWAALRHEPPEKLEPRF